MYDVIMKAFRADCIYGHRFYHFFRDLRFYPGHRAYSDSTGRPAA